MAHIDEIQTKIIKRGIVRPLIDFLGTTNALLMRVSLQFLKKLSVFHETKQEMMTKIGEFLDFVSKILKSQEDKLEVKANRELALKLVFNLSHDMNFSEAVLKSECGNILVELLKVKGNIPLVTKILYQLSIQRTCRSNPVFIDASQVVLSFVLEIQDFNSVPLLLPLLVNLATDPFISLNISRSG